MCAEDDFKGALNKAGERVTSPRLAVFRMLTRNGPISMPKLIDAAEQDSIDRVTVYRTIDLLRKLGLIQEVGLGRNRLFELSDDFHAHHHHFTCVKCGKIIDFDSDVIESNLDHISDNLGFDIRSHQLELTGICKDCSKS